MSIYYKYAPDGTNIVVLYYVGGCVYWYTYKSLREWFMDDLGKRFHVNFLIYAHWFMSIIIYQMKDYYIYVYQAGYDTSIVAKYLYNNTVKSSTKFYKTTFPYYMIFIKADASTKDEKFDKLTREFNIHRRACIGSLVHLLYTRVYLSFLVHKLERF